MTLTLELGERLKVRIKVGTAVVHDHGIGKWPATKGGDDVDPDMEFDAEWNGKFWDCRADGYGRRTWKGESGGYGNGSIFAFGFDGVEVLTSNVEVTGAPPSGANNGD